MTKIDEIREKVDLGEFCISNTQTTDFPGGYPNYDDKWNHEEFKKKFRINVKSITEREMEFDMIGIDCAIANSLRRIMLSEVPTMAIDRVEIINNTSLVQDEVLAHRLGLIPIAADPMLFIEIDKDKNLLNVAPCADDTVKFILKAKCIKNPNASKDAADPDELYINHTVRTEKLKWSCIKDQRTIFPDGLRPADEDIIIAKLRPGQEIHCNVYCHKGIGRTHAKFSPVATASYRIHPEIVITKPVVGTLAERLQACFPKGVIGLKDVNGEPSAFVNNSRLDTSSREVLRYGDLKNCVKLLRIRDHFIFSIESTGSISPEAIFLSSISILQNKCKKLISEIRNEDESAVKGEDNENEMDSDDTTT